MGCSRKPAKGSDTFFRIGGSEAGLGSIERAAVPLLGSKFGCDVPAGMSLLVARSGLLGWSVSAGG